MTSAAPGHGAVTSFGKRIGYRVFTWNLKTPYPILLPQNLIDDNMNHDVNLTSRIKQSSAHRHYRAETSRLWIWRYQNVSSSAKSYVLETTNDANGFAGLFPKRFKKMMWHPDMGMTQNWIMSRLRIKCFSLESWVNLSQKLESILNHESIWINTWESARVMSWFWVNS